MNPVDVIRMALRALAGRKLRSSLTMLSIFLGAFSIVLMTSLADSGLNTLIKDIEDLGGARLMLLAPKSPVRMKDKAGLSPGMITEEDRRVLKERVPYLVGWSFWAEGNDDFEVERNDGRLMATDIVGTDAGFFSVFGMEPDKGRFYTDDDNERHARVCVVGNEIADKLFDGNAIGQRITVGPVRCVVVGQVKEKKRMGMHFGFDWGAFVAVPLEYVRELNPEMAAGAMIHLKTASSDKNDIAKRVANAILAASHHGVDDYEIYDFKGIVGKFHKVFSILKVIVGVVASIALLVGGVGVMNMMFVSVSERKKEIGIRKALGASPKKIQAQFLCEAAMLAGSGGVVGAGFGVLAILGANAFISSLEPAWAGTVSVPAVIAALAASILTGVVFGTVPAQRAAALDPVAAIRS